MYFEHFGLYRPPFDETTNPSFHYATPAHQVVMDRIVTQLQTGGMVLVVGPDGVGKSMFGQVLRKRLDGDVKVLAFSAPGEGPRTGLKRICTAFGLEGYAAADAEQCVAQMVELVAQQTRVCCLVLIDQAENLSADDLLVLHRLVQAADGTDLKLCIVLQAALAIKDTLRQPELRLVEQKLVAAPPLTPLADEDVPRYLATRLEAAGAERRDIFAPAAIRKIAGLANGLPRRINALAKRAMRRAAEQKLRQVDEASVLPCSKESEAMNPTSACPDASHPRPQTTTAASSAVCDAAAGRLQDRADAIVEQALARLERACAGAGGTGERAVLAEDLVWRLEQAIARGDETLARLGDFTHKLTQIGQTSEERVALLLTSLDTAQGIHEKLEGVGAQISALVEEAQRSTAAEHEQLQTLVDEVSQQRAALSGMIDGARQERRAALEENRREIEEQLRDIRAEADRARQHAVRAIEDVRQSSEQALAEHHAALKQNREAVAKDIAEGREATAGVLQDARGILGEVQRVDGDVRRQIETVRAQTGDYAERIRAMQDARNQAERITQQAVGANQRIEAALADTRTASEELAARTTRATQLGAELIADLERAGSQAGERVAEQIARLEHLVAIEQDARTKAEQAVQAARAALATAAQSEAHLAQAQQAALDVKSVATAALAAAQTQIKRVEESVDVVVRFGIEKAQNEVAALVQQAAERSTAIQKQLEDAAAAAADRVDSTSAAAVQQVDAASAAAASRVDEAVAGALENLSARRQETEGKLNLVVESAAQAIDEKLARLHDEAERIGVATRAKLDNARAAAVNDMNNDVAAAVSRGENAVADALATLTAGVQENVAAANESIATLGRNESARFMDTIATARHEAEVGIAHVATERIDAAAAAMREIEGVLTQGRETIARADTCREQIDHAVHKAESLVATADQRVSTLETLIENTRSAETNLDALVAQARTHAAALSSQTAAAGETAEMLVDRHQRAEQAVAALAAGVAEANGVGQQIENANRSGRELAAELTGQMGELTANIETARKLHDDFQAAEDTTKLTCDAVVRLQAATAALETRMAQLQEDLANPLAVIQDARGQAEELNEICLAVKRVFRSVSQASLQADERLKLLGKLFTAAERSSETLRQWVEEAAHAQQRLAATLQSVPTIGATHPVVPAPEFTPLSAPGANLGASDRAVLQRLAGQTSIPDVANASAQPRPPALQSVSRVARHVQPLADALKARDEHPAPAAAKPNRLSAEDVRAMIADARKEAAAQS